MIRYVFIFLVFGLFSEHKGLLLKFVDFVVDGVLNGGVEI